MFVGDISDQCTHSKIQLDEARASLRSHADTLHDVEYERDILRIEVGKALAERDEALEQTKNLEQTLEALRQEVGIAELPQGRATSDYTGSWPVRGKQQAAKIDPRRSSMINWPAWRRV